MSRRSLHLAPASGSRAGRAGELFRRAGRWLWKKLELSPEAMIYADPLYLSPALALFAFEAEGQALAADSDVSAVEPRRLRKLSRQP